jgi:quinolinate synthase
LGCKDDEAGNPLGLSMQSDAAGQSHSQHETKKTFGNHSRQHGAIAIMTDSDANFSGFANFSKPSLPECYLRMDSAELFSKILARKAKLADDLCILGHHYQHDDVVQFADVVGDSLKLSQYAATQTQAKYIVFCGVHFMAESADILTHGKKIVCLPNALAGCAMADMADAEAIESALQEMQSLAGPAKVVPITYVNSTADAKAVTAKFGGACCTSSNVANVFKWAFAPQATGGAGADKIFAIPDEHLGRNTAAAMGYPLDSCVVYDPKKANGGLDRLSAGRAKFILWKGNCYVHQVFSPDDILRVRADRPGVRVIVHPECPHDVVALADSVGSTEHIIQAVEQSADGSVWAIGTESNLVARLARRFASKTIVSLSNRQAYCKQMARITPGHLLWVLDSIADAGADIQKIVNRVTVPPSIADQARIALERMIQIKATASALSGHRPQPD